MKRHGIKLGSLITVFTAVAMLASSLAQAGVAPP